LSAFDQFGISFGNILTMITMVGSVMAMIRNNDRAMTLHEAAMKNVTDDVSEMKGDIKELRAAFIQLSSQKVQIDFLIKAYDDLRHRRGFIVDAETE